MPNQCVSCRNFVKLEQDEQGLCVQEKVTLKGGRYCAAKPAKTANECKEFIARDAKQS